MKRISGTTPSGHRVTIESVDYGSAGQQTKQSHKALFGGVVVAKVDEGIYDGNAIEKLLADADKTIETAKLQAS
jgi:hypothetical protein